MTVCGNRSGTGAQLPVRPRGRGEMWTNGPELGQLQKELALVFSFVFLSYHKIKKLRKKKKKKKKKKTKKKKKESEQ